MKGNITPGDIVILSHIAEYKILTVRQLSAITQRTIQVIRRRLRFLEEEQFIIMIERGFGKGPGRRENIVILTQRGIELLSLKKILSPHAAYITSESSNSIFIDHDLLVNWFFIHLLQIERMRPQFTTQHLTANSHSITEGKAEKPLLMERLSAGKASEETYTMIPDGVFIITDRESDKTILFFLEADRGTESLVKTENSPGDIRHKITGYQALFRSNRYKRYDRIFNAKFNGFRLLFLTINLGRKKSICDFVQTMRPSDFIWVADQSQMFSLGISAEIWSRGGRCDKLPESILGRKLAFEAPAYGQHPVARKGCNIIRARV